MDKVFQIFRSGAHTAMSGVTRIFSDDDLRMIAATYPQDEKRAPLTLGHPDDDLPVLGRVKRLFFKRGGLFAHADVSGTLIGLVREGRYKNLSAAFYAPGHPQNPSPFPRVYSLKHVGFLGANPPAVRGMEPLGFSEPSEGIVCCFSGCDLERCADELPGGFLAHPDCRADPERLGLWSLAEEYRRGCPTLSFAEAAQLANGYF